MKSRNSKSRSAARLAAVQALYQMDMEKVGLARLLDEFHAHRLGAEIEDAQYAEAEVDFFDDVVAGVNARRAEIDALIDGKLGEMWKMGRLDKTMLQILRCGTYELIARADIPTGAVIDEYMDVAHAFFDKKDAKFVNGLLDAVAKDVRG
ncbi:MAG TPA: transcription antitermination factor NusB [Sphingorhabdus lacus]|jgi:N utilization substance protein B|uniref:Transcription antitermination protein NusB n=1 Tax=Sphingorhabdus lacus TaxID=392610 RepID=A0A6I6LBQ2_9SPHN|nr:transcription antitermination factor NusB [Sphingorhabdus lacus]QGY79673.1 transcription antitermination factor NusB [Sphingorhabdus lacus]HNW19534.1 transcription antitermination factor NusB [Sphingorhabdus lacus]HPV67070.1 transcription antitermination factor NusB [Sphingorhabdus lacus]